MRFRDRIQAGYELRNFLDWEDIFRVMTLMRSWNNEFQNRRNQFLADYDADAAAHTAIQPAHSQAILTAQIRFGQALPAALDPPAPARSTWVVVQNLRDLLNFDNGYGFNTLKNHNPASLPRATPPPGSTPLKRYAWPDFRYDRASHRVTADRTSGIFVNLYFTTGLQHRCTITRRTACSPATYQALLIVLSLPHSPSPPRYNPEGDCTPRLRGAGAGAIGLPPRFRRLYHGVPPAGGWAAGGVNGQEARELILPAMEEYGLGESVYIRRGEAANYRPYPGAEIRPGDTGQCGWRRGAGSQGGHAFYIYAIRYHQNRTWFQILSAQSSSSGVGIMGFRESNPPEYADLPEPLVNNAHATWYCLETQRVASSWNNVTHNTLQVDGSMASLMAARCWRRPRMPLFLVRDWRRGDPGDNRLYEDRWHANPRRVALFYHRNNVRGSAGFFPFGANRVWHGGIHLYPAREERRVTAVADGRICAVRFEPTDRAPAALNGKSRNFILIRHDLPEYRAACQNGAFFSFYMHLEDEDYNPTASQRDQLWWRGYVQRLNLGNRLHGGQVVTFAADQGIHVQAGDVIGHVAPNYGLAPAAPAGGGGGAEGAGVARPAPPPTLHFEILAAQTYFPRTFGFRELVDDDNTACVERARFVDVAEAGEGERLWELINQDMLPGSRVYVPERGRSYPVWSREELAHFYRESPWATWLRTFACKHISEWGDRVNYDDLRNMMQYRHLNRASIDQAIEEARAFVWWTDEVARAVGLPEDQKVYHYHPLRFLLCLNQRMEEQDP